VSTAIFEDDDCFVGYTRRECGEHRTVGSRRAWCFDCHEWCYSHSLDMACKGCQIPWLRARLGEA
jgi:hypothetical protein